MMTSRSDYGMMPKKRVTTYGKASRRRTQTSGLFSKAESAMPPSVTSPPSSGPDPKPPRRVATAENKPNTFRKYKRSGRPEDSSTTHSQPLPAEMGMEFAAGKADDSRPASKKRKLTRSQSEKREMSAGVYSTPDSSPTGVLGRAELDAIYDIESSAPSPATTWVKALPEVKVLKRKATSIAAASKPTHDTYDFDESDNGPPIRARSTLAKPSNTTAKPTLARPKPFANPRPTSISTERKQQEVSRRLSRDNPARPTGITKSKPPLATARAIAQAKPALETKQMAQVKTATQPRKPSQSKPAGPPSPSSRIVTQRPIPEPRVKVVAPPAPAPAGRTRLIDALAAQVEESSSEGEQDESQPAEAMSFSPFSQNSSQAFGLASAPAPSPAKPRTIVRAVSLVKKSGLKFTYGMARTTTLADDDLVMGGLGVGSLDDASSSKAPLFDLEQMKVPTSSFSFADEDEETANPGAVRSVHELRQAGASSRFADDMSDILDRIGAPSNKPSSLRRGALFELAEKLQEKDFRRQFRTHGSGSLFEHLDKETDIVAGYATACILVTLLGTLPSDHLIQKLASQGIADLLTLLLVHDMDIRAVARDRKSNLSKHGQKTLLGIKDSLLKLSIWEPGPPSALSPRTLALKCAEMILRQTTDLVSESKIFSTSMTEFLFSILSAAVSDETYWDFPARCESTDFYLALFLLESHSITAMQSEFALTWTEKYVPCIASIFEVTLNRPAEKLGDLEGLVLRLVLNTTNNNAAACAAYADKGLLRGVTDAASRTFSTLSASIQGDAFQSTVFDSLVLMSGVLINFCEHYPPSAQDLADAEAGQESPASRLIRVFLDYHSKTTDADSIEKGKLNVAFGYLSVALGYFCLHEDIREKFERLHTKRTIAPLLNAIREFVRFHKMAAPTMDGAEPGRSDHAMLTVEKLVDRLEK